LVSRLRPRDGVSRVASALVVYVPSPLPRWSCWVLIAPFPSSGSFPCEVVRSASTLLFSRPAQRLLTLQPAHSPNRLTILSIEGFRRLVALPSAPIATGWSDPCREGFAPSQELCLSTAHDFITTTLAFRFSVNTGWLWRRAVPSRLLGAAQSGNEWRPKCWYSPRTLESFTVGLPKRGGNYDDTAAIWVAGVVVLGITLAYGLRNRTRTARERAITEEATKENYRQEGRSSK
jgi:hypothetical protein